MRSILLVARREFLQIARTRSFWITLLLLPVVFLTMPVLGRLMQPPPTSSYLLYDASGRYDAAVEAQIALDAQADTLFAFSRYAERWGLKSNRPDAVWDDGRLLNDDEVRAFFAAGGVPQALREAGPLPQDAPPFAPPPPSYRRAPLPGDVSAGGDVDAFGATVARYLIGGEGRPKGYRAAVAAIYIPADVDRGAPVRIWVANGKAGDLVNRLRDEMDRHALIRAAQAAGVGAATARTLQASAAPMIVTAPPHGDGGQRLALRSALPLGLAYFLLISVFTSGAWLLQGVIEERSNKLLEAVLACVSPGQLLYGKLLGIMGIGFSVILVWAGCALFGASLLPGDMSRTAMSVFSSPGLAVALLFYFVAGYLICATLFLAIGAMCESMTDAQAYLSPISLMLFLPFVFLGQLVSNPDALGAKVLSWVPFYTPFAMMARMGAGVEPWEVLGTGLLLIVFIALELYLLGRLFRGVILRTGQPPKLAELGRLLFKPSAG